MGFFSSRKPEDTENRIPISSKDSQDKSVASVIRSRFYGKNKGKERDEQPNTSFAAQSVSAAHTLSNPTPSSSAHIRQPSPLSKTQNANSSILRVQQDNKPLPSTPSRKTVHGMSTMGSDQSPSSSRPSAASALRQKSSNFIADRPRPPTDNATVTLAQRLNELAVANSEGLLSDDEYRLLRQNLFERFATNTTVPTETSLVPVSLPQPRGTTSTQERKSIPRPLSNFQVEVNRSPSIRSKSSMTSGVASFLRRATSRRASSASKDYSDTSSIFSSSSISSGIFKRGLSKKSSSSSVRTTTSRPQGDAMSISSRQGTGKPEHSSSSHGLPSASRSTASIRHMATPPSSFPSRVIGNDIQRMSAFNPDMQGDGPQQSTAEIRQEILAVEAELKRLMDAFNGLEMTMLAKLQRHQDRDTLHENGDTIWAVMPSERSQRRIIIVDNDAASLKSATSAGTGISMARSAHSGHRATRRTALNASVSLNAIRPGSLHRKDSTSSITSQDRKYGVRSKIPPVPALPEGYGSLGAGSISNVSLARSTGHTVMSVVHEDEQPSPISEDERGETSMDDIRRRREEVAERYYARLEYLQAKLKGAQLHEKLARK